MRLSLGALVAVIAAGCAGGVTHTATSRVHVYDDPHLTVVSPAVRDEVEVGDSRVSADYAIDVVSGATWALTVDAVSSATRFSERRHQAGVAAAHALSPETEVSSAYTASVEPDHTVHAPSVGVTRELLDRMVRATARYQLLLESIGRVDADAFSASAQGHRLDLGWTQIATRSVVVTGLATATAYRCSADLGCFASPYRHVSVAGPTGGPVALSERHPDVRFTGAGALRLAWAFTTRSALHAGYRFAHDSWGVAAHTADAAAVAELFASRLLIRAEARGTAQGAAGFYASAYVGDDVSAPAYRTADAELSSLWNARLLLHLEWDWGPVRLVGELGRMWNRYPDFPALPARDAWIGALGIDAVLE